MDSRASYNPISRRISQMSLVLAMPSQTKHSSECYHRQAFKRSADMIATWRAIHLAIVLLLTLFPITASAQLFPAACSSTGTCPDGFICQPGFFGRVCMFERCNANSDCSKRGAVCSLGQCSGGVTTGSGGGGGGVTPSREGGRCGPQRFGNVTKNIPCRQGLICNRFGRCQRPLQ